MFGTKQSASDINSEKFLRNSKDKIQNLMLRFGEQLHINCSKIGFTYDQS